MFTQVGVFSCPLCTRPKLDIGTQKYTCYGPVPQGVSGQLGQEQDSAGSRRLTRTIKKIWPQEIQGGRDMDAYNPGAAPWGGGVANFKRRTCGSPPESSGAETHRGKNHRAKRDATHRPCRVGHALLIKTPL